ncbi:hypothetical protein ES707_14570 [subsurface metagenome]
MAEPDILDITKPIKLIFTKEINSLWKADLDIEKNDYIQEEAYVEFNGILFIAKKINEIKDKKGRLISSIKLDHLQTELNDFSIAPFEYNGITCEAALALVLSGTTWSAGTVDISGTGNVKSDKRITVLKAVQLIAKEFYGELDFRTIKQQDGSFTRIVDLKQQIGTATKLQIRYDKNSDYIRRERDSIGLITRLYIYGKDDITIESVNPTGKPYLDSANIGNYLNIKEDTKYTNITDKTVLMNYGQAVLDSRDTKILRYRINTWDATIIPKWADEVINLGDTSRVYDSDLKINVDVRNKKLIKDLIDPRYQKIELADKFKSIVEPISDVEQAIKNITFNNDYRSLDIRDSTIKDSTFSFKPGADSGLPMAYIIILSGKLKVSLYQGPVIPVYRPFTATKLWAYIAQPVYVGAASDIIIDVFRTGISIGTITIPMGSQVGTTDINVPLAIGDLLNLGIWQTDGVAEILTVLIGSE